MSPSSQLSRVVTLLTDCGPASLYVGQLHAVLLTRAPDVRVLDLAHDVPAGAIRAASYVLRRSYPLCPPGSVHVVVVDPGVGTRRAILAAAAHGHLFVGPDNGVLYDVVREGEVRSVENPELMAPRVSNTFHGRDIMAPVAASLACGTPLAEVGPVIVPQAGPAASSPRPRAGGVEGEILFVDRYGNLVTDLERAQIQAVGGENGAIRVRLADAFIDRLVTTFGDVAEGRVLAYIGSGDHLVIGVNGGRAKDLLGVDVGDPVRLEPLE